MSEQTTTDQTPPAPEIVIDRPAESVHDDDMMKETTERRILPNVAFVLLALLMILAVSMMFGGPVRDLIEQWSEANSTDYADMSRVAASCPPTAASARQAMADGKLNQAEVRRVARVMFDANHAHELSSERARASIANGGPRIAVTPECSTWDGGTENTLSSPMFFGYRSMANFR